MLIAAFARESRLSVDAVRLYVRRGLLHPKLGAKGGSRPYHMFSALDIEKTRIIRAGQALRLSLKDVGTFINARSFKDDEGDVVITFLTTQREHLVQRIAESERLISYVDAKIAWLKDPSVGPSPPYPH
ncbi:MerR family transcriptional regulator [Lichenicoccus sp.]|uniref:MerR family transcriptional regulator n=1 Tax=Lichenicoccus sp. TaxID=2781899 RepID=UPI003D1130F1